MSQMNLDQHGRHRNVTVAFRVSPEEAKLINAQVAMSGMTKQDYITSRLLNREVKVVCPAVACKRRCASTWTRPTVSCAASAMGRA